MPVRATSLAFMSPRSVVGIAKPARVAGTVDPFGREWIVLAEQLAGSDPFWLPRQCCHLGCEGRRQGIGNIRRRHAPTLHHILGLQLNFATNIEGVLWTDQLRTEVLVVGDTQVLQRV